MKFAPFWAKGTSGAFSCWRSSFRDAAEAQALADQAAQNLAERFAHHDIPPRHHGYYPNRPFREPVLREIKNRTGELVAVVTRNSYGCLVLNTARVMFVDVDLPAPGRSGGFWRRLFGKPEPPPATDPQGEVIAKAAAWARDHSGWGWRIYRTRAGLRLLATHALFEPDGEIAESVFSALGADPLYRQLCKSQKCFRARLTPKPWRCGVHDRPERWPWPDGKAEARFQKWESRYQEKCRAWATCLSLGKHGRPDLHPDVELVIGLHDDATRAASELELA